MAYRTGNVRRQHRDSKSLIRKHGSGSGGGNKKKMAKATLKPKQVSATNTYGGGIIESHMDDLVDRDDE